MNRNWSIVWAYGLIPILVIYRDDDHPDFTNRQGFVTYWFIFMRIEIVKSARNDVGLLAHELRHCEMILDRPIQYRQRYKSDKGRLLIEAECYAVQLIAYGNITDDEFIRRHELFATFMVTHYNLPYNYQTCYTEIASALEQERASELIRET